MALDLTIDATKKEPVVHVALEENDHEALMKIVEARKLPVLRRLSDYYGKADLAPSEMAGLREEIKQVLAALPAKGAESLRRTLGTLRDMTHESERRRLSILAVGD